MQTKPNVSKMSLSLLLASNLFLIACANSGNTTLNSGDDRLIWSNSPVLKNTVNGSLITLTLSATVVPPTVNGVSLDADDVFPGVLNSYVSYNIPGNTHSGGIDQILLSNPVLPVRTASTTFATSTVNSVYVNGNNVYAVGSTTDATTTGWPAYITELNIGLAGLTGFSSPVLTSGLLDTYAGTAVTMWNGSLYALSGANGNSTSQGLQVLNSATFAQTATLTIADARGMSSYYGGGTDLFVVAGRGNVYDINSANTIAHTIVVGGNTIAESKSTIQVGKTMIAVSKGDAGAAIVCQADQKILATLPAVGAVGSLTAAQTVTNGVAAGPGLLFVANGQAGLYVYTMVNSAASASVCNSVTLTFAGTISLGSTTYSANNVRYVGGMLYVATGTGGFKIISVTAIPAITGANSDFM